MKPPPLDIVVSKKINKKEIEQLKTLLSGEQIIPNVIRCNVNENIEKLPRFSDGIWWIQDVASQVPCNLLLSKMKTHFSKPINSVKILDMCCAQGGKTSQLLDNKLGYGTLKN